MTLEFAFVLDSEGVKLPPTKASRAGYLIRKGRAILLSKAPLVIQLTYKVENPSIPKTIVGVDTGSKETGVALVQQTAKPIFKGTIIHRQDISKRMELRKSYRQYRRWHKRYRPSRFLNRASSRREVRVPPSIKSKKDEILRVVKHLSRYITVTSIVVEDIRITLSSLQEGHKAYKWDCQKSAGPDNNLRLAALYRDDYTCQNCKAKDTRLEAHHIVPRRLKGSNTLSNLITLCSPCHKSITGVEEKYILKFQAKISGRNINFVDSQHAMQGKQYLYDNLSLLAPVTITTGVNTSNKRKDLGIEKTHSNDALVICGECVTQEQTNIYEYQITPLRKKSEATKVVASDIKQRDVVIYTRRNKEPLLCKVRAILQSGLMVGQYKLRDFSGNYLGPVPRKSLKLIWRFKSIMYI